MKPLRFVRVSIVAGICVVSANVLAQPRPEFDVASIRVATGPNGVRGGCHGIDFHYSPNELATAPPLGRCVVSDGRLSHLIGIAYGVPMNRIKDAPDWVIAGTERFTIQAEAEDPTKATEAQLLAMLQNLLADRFQLRFHRENKDQPGFALMVGKKGAKLQPAQGDEVAISFGRDFKPSPGQPVFLSARKYSMEMLAGLLSQIGPGPMIDQTGLPGAYDFKLSWDESAGPTLGTALEEQLGLRLEAQKVPVSFFMFESAQRPAGN
jgi:uncharacterized protein (TIGR03435 family)